MRLSTLSKNTHQVRDVEILSITVRYVAILTGSAKYETVGTFSKRKKFCGTSKAALRGQGRSALVATVAGAGSLRRRPLCIGRLLATTVTTGAGRATEAHLGSVTRGGLSGRTAVVALLAVLRC